MSDLEVFASELRARVLTGRSMHKYLDQLCTNGDREDSIEYIESIEPLGRRRLSRAGDGYGELWRMKEDIVFVDFNLLVKKGECVFFTYEDDDCCSANGFLCSAATIVKIDQVYPAV